jgi:hypothetical protein
MFGAQYSNQLPQPSLAEDGVQQLFRDDHVVEDFKSLNRALLVHYLDLVRGMRLGENQEARLAAMETILVNMHFIINSKRPEQARQMVSSIAHTTVLRQQRLCEELDIACDEAEALLEPLESETKRRKE